MNMPIIIALILTALVAGDENITKSSEDIYFEISPFETTEFRCPFCYCGKTYKKSEDIWTRVVGGWPTQPRQYPWMVALVTKRKNRLFCGGTIISDIYVLTAAHCLQNHKGSDIEIVLSDGDHIDMERNMAERRSVIEVITHELFHIPRKYNNDIALLKVNKPILLSLDHPPACLPSPGKSFAGDMAKVVGWGLTSENGTKSKWLREALVPILSVNTCKTLAGFMTITSSMMCAAPLSGGVDSCQGDSGGPLLVQQENERIAVAGIVSWGIGCARPYKPGIYTRVNQFLDWIAENTRDACFCY